MKLANYRFPIYELAFRGGVLATISSSPLCPARSKERPLRS